MYRGLMHMVNWTKRAVVAAMSAALVGATMLVVPIAPVASAVTSGIVATDLVLNLDPTSMPPTRGAARP